MRAHIGDVDMAWFEVGRGSPLVLIHGLADDHRAWRRCLPDLSLRHRVLLYDFRGHGQSKLGQAQGSLAQLAEDLNVLLDAVELERVSLAGFSLGGTIAMRFAIDHPDRVERLLPVATSSRVGRSAAEWYAERARLVEEASPQLRKTIESDTRSMFENAPNLFEEHWQIRSQSTAEPAGYANACLAMAALGQAPLDPDLGRIRAPTLVVAADRDPLCPPRAGEIICAGIPGSRLEIVAGSGHQIPVERPAELSRLVLDFLADS
jgi:pimeloyl-ACP methyl ester carboxylesterase